MTTPTRYVLLTLIIILFLHLLLGYSHHGYSEATSLSHLAGAFRTPSQSSSRPQLEELVGVPQSPVLERKANAAFVVLARNGDLDGVITSMKQMEDRFNKQFNYPWVFLNEEPFSAQFKKWTSEITSSNTTYGLIPRDHWYQPDWIDEDKAKKSRQAMVKQEVIYGDSVPYRNMCRYNSGFFFRHPLLDGYRYYWRVEPGIKFYCDLHFDPFLYMQDHNKVYGFTISLFEYPLTIPTLWNTVKSFIKEHPQFLPEDNAMSFLSPDKGETYNLCHFWSNFEIADLDFWRSDAYTTFFEYLDKSGGFYYERWGDAPVHSIAAALFARKDQLHFFNEIGYRHEPFEHCPTGEAHALGKCWCNEGTSFDREWYSCLNQFDAIF